MKVLKENQLGPWCSFCPPKTKRATHRDHGFTGLFCCADHQQQLIEYENKRTAREQHLGESDYQSWGRL